MLSMAQGIDETALSGRWGNGIRHCKAAILLKKIDLKGVLKIVPISF